MNIITRFRENVNSYFKNKTYDRVDLLDVCPGFVDIKLMMYLEKRLLSVRSPVRAPLQPSQIQPIICNLICKAMLSQSTTQAPPRSTSTLAIPGQYLKSVQVAADGSNAHTER